MNRLIRKQIINSRIKYVKQVEAELGKIYFAQGNLGYIIKQMLNINKASC